MQRLSPLFSLAFLLLASCASQQVAREGKYPVKGICRSCKPHMIKGVWYTPQLHYDYDETAIASWYGPRFHGKQKACGEIFDQNDISAAHKTLPLPTVVRVSNLENGKSIDLIIDDRGPYVDGRIIDLSIGAAKALGCYSKGTAKVRVQSLPSHSHALSMYLARNGNKWGVDKQGRTWREVYLEEIADKYPDDTSSEGGSASVTHVPGHGGKMHEDIVPIKTESGTATIEDILEVAAPTKKNIKVSAPAPVPTAAKPLALKGRQQSSAKALSPSAQYYVHLTSFISKANALKRAEEISNTASNVSVKTVNNSGQLFYDVRCGPYPSEASAKIALTNLDVLGHNPQLIKE